jgi:hypothetical protein
MSRGRKPGGPKTGGRVAGTPNKATLDIKALAQEHGPELLGILVSLAKDDETPHAARVAASKEVLDRGYGKASQIMGEDKENPFANLPTVIERRYVEHPDKS